MALQTGADVIRADAWRFLFIYGDFVVNNGGNILQAALNDHHFDIINVSIFLTDYKYFHLSGYVPSFLGFFSAITLALFFLWGITYQHRNSLQNKLLGSFVCFLILPTAFITITAPQYFTWNLVTIVGVKLLLVYGVLSLSFLETSRNTLIFACAATGAFLVGMLTNTFATLICLSIIASSVVIFGLANKINSYRILGLLGGMFLASYTIRQLGFDSASAVISFDGIELLPTILSVAKGAALAFFSPVVSKAVIEAYAEELLVMHFLFVCFAVYSIYKSRHANSSLLVIIVSLYMLYLATYLSALLFRFGISDPVGVAFVPRYYPLYVCGSASLAFLVFYSYLYTAASFDRVIFFSFFSLFTFIKVAAFYEFSSTYVYTKTYFDTERSTIFCYKGNPDYASRSSPLSGEKLLEATKYLEDNNLSVFYLNREGFFDKPLSCAKS